MWEFDLNTSTWREVLREDGTFEPVGRSGHASVVLNNKMFVFGGIFEITKELNEMI